MISDTKQLFKSSCSFKQGDENIRIAKINHSFIYEGSTIEIFISGCKHACEGCQNPELWDFDYGTEMSVEEVIKYANEKFFSHRILGKWDSFVLTGGDPLWSKEATIELVKAIKEEYPWMKVWLYTGFTKEEIDQDPMMSEIFGLCDVVITDRFDKAFPRTNLTGSSNQRIWRK